VFRFSPATVSASQFDRLLPDIPFWYWLNSILVKHGSEPLHELQWNAVFCDERTREPEAVKRRLDICAMIIFQVGTIVGGVWIRTGRVDFSNAEMVQWFATPPTFEAVRFLNSESTDIHELSMLDGLLETSPESWPAPEVSIAPQDIVIAPISTARNAARVTATIRNTGGADAHGVFVEMIGGDYENPATSRHFVVNIPRHGAAQLHVDVAYPRGYGLMFVHVFPGLTDHAAFGTWRDDPVPENNIAFRVINPAQAPKALLARLRAELCGSGRECRGY
jgi:hypothetical protein